MPGTADVPPPASAPQPAAKPRRLPQTLVLALLLLAVSAANAAYDPEIEAVQRALTVRGYDPGPIDGAMGWRTRGALREFQRAAGIPDTGRIDDATRTALGLAPRNGPRPPPAGDADSGGADDTARTEPAAVPQAAAPKAEPDRAEIVIVPGSNAAKAEPDRTEPAALPGASVPKAAPDRTELVIVPETDASKAGPAGAEPAALPETATPKAAPARTELVIVPETDASKAEPAGAEPTAVPETAAPEAEAARTEPAVVPESAVARTETARTEPATAPQAPARTTEAAPAQSTPARAPRPKLDFAMLGWHRPQTGAEARARFDAIGAPPEFRRGRGTLFVPKGELVFVLKAGERFPGLDCDPGAGRLSIEFVFGPDGPVIFTPTGNGELCQAGIGIAIEMGRTLEIRRVDWGNMQLPPGTVRVTGQGLEYVR